MKPYFSTILSHCVPLPLPGPPDEIETAMTNVAQSFKYNDLKRTAIVIANTTGIKITKYKFMLDCYNWNKVLTKPKSIKYITTCLERPPIWP